MMPIIVFALLISAALLTPAQAQTSDRRPPPPPATTKVLPLKGAAGANPCSAYGQGFVRLESTGTCVKLGGSVSAGATVGR